jgi:hypothetical protein
MKTMRTSTSCKQRRTVWLGCFLLSFLCLGTQPASAADDFSQIVHGIESRYHVHRNYRFLMGLAGWTVNVWHVAGAKDLKLAVFEDQRLGATGDELDQVVAGAGARGWQPLVRSVNHHSGENTLIYVRDLGKDLRVLLVDLEPNESVVLEMTVKQEKLIELIDGHRSYRMHAGAELAANQREERE